MKLKSWKANIQNIHLYYHFTVQNEKCFWYNIFFDLLLHISVNAFSIEITIFKYDFISVHLYAFPRMRCIRRRCVSIVRSPQFDFSLASLSHKYDIFLCFLFFIGNRRTIAEFVILRLSFSIDVQDFCHCFRNVNQVVRRLVDCYLVLSNNITHLY